MKFALVDNHRKEATKGDKGICPVCASELIARCGDYKVNHWAHKSIRTCDPWWENETEWHRSWKNSFPDDWQEIALHDDHTGEKHIADVRTSHGLVIEFQHSHIDPQERTSREKFYKRMVWVVDGTRLKRDYSRFLKGKKYFQKTKEGFFLVDYPETCFPPAWLESSVPVFFDFRGTESIDDLNDRRNYLYCLFPKGSKREVIVAEISRESFIHKTIHGELFKKQAPPSQNRASRQPKTKVIRINRPESQYILERGRLRKRYPRL